MRRANPLEIRARELAVAAGVDPDSRVPKPGSERGMPAWCSFQDAARAEQNKAEAEAAAATIVNLRQQESRFQNSPLTVMGEHDEATVAQMRNCMSVGNAVAGVICADGHLGYAQPVGGVIAYEQQISISGVGFDIGCGNLAVRLDVPFAAVADRASQIAHDISRNISFGVGRINAERVEHELFDDKNAWVAADREDYRQKARDQLGTCGAGNHYVDLMCDEEGLVWIGVHFGSRGLGHTSATHYLKLAGGQDGIHVPPAVVDEGSEVGHRYLAAMHLAGRYAYAGREWVAERVRRIIGGNVTDSIHNHHNFCVAGDQIVPTVLGPKRMADIRAGDEVYAFLPSSGLETTAVTRHWFSGRKPILRIGTASRSLRVSADHPIQVVDIESAPHPDRLWHSKRNGMLAWKRAGDIRLGDVIVCAEGYYRSHDCLDYTPASRRETEYARFIGAFVGDGWTRADTSRRGHTVGLAIGGPNDEHTADYKELVERLFPMSEWRDPSTRGPVPSWRSNRAGEYGLTISCKKLHAHLSQEGIAGTCHDKRLPALVFDFSRENKLACIAGYIDADGSVANSATSNHGRAYIASVNRGLVEDLRELAISCQLRITPIRQEYRETSYGPCLIYLCVMSAGSAAELPLWHRRKAANQRRPKRADCQALQDSKIGYLDLPTGLFGQRVQSIAPDGEEDVYDLAVTHPTHSFVCEGIVVHNCWLESHVINGVERDLWVVRKGATPAFPGQRGFVGGSMGDDAVILEGVDSPQARASLYSTVHGAGRLFGRKQAKRTFTRAQMDEWIRERGVTLIGADLDESPMAYRRLPDVLAHHTDSVAVLHTLRPFVVVMAGRDVADPFKD